MLVDDLNKELVYKAGEIGPVPEGRKFLSILTDGEDHKILLFDIQVYSTALEKQMENIPLREDMLLNEREHFEPYLRALINDELEIIKNLEL